MKMVNFHQEGEGSILTFQTDPFPLSETLLEHGREMEQFKSSQGLEDHEIFQIEWPRDHW